MHGNRTLLKSLTFGLRYGAGADVHAGEKAWRALCSRPERWRGFHGQEDLVTQHTQAMDGYGRIFTRAEDRAVFHHEGKRFSVCRSVADEVDARCWALLAGVEPEVRVYKDAKGHEMAMVEIPA